MTRVQSKEHESELSVAARHVAEARRIVARQHERIARLKARGSCTRDFERTLDLFVSTLRILEDHERDLREAAAKPTQKTAAAGVILESLFRA